MSSMSCPSPGTPSRKKHFIRIPLGFRTLSLFAPCPESPRLTVFTTRSTCIMHEFGWVNLGSNSKGEREMSRIISKYDLRAEGGVFRDFSLWQLGFFQVMTYEIGWVLLQRVETRMRNYGKNKQRNGSNGWQIFSEPWVERTARTVSFISRDVLIKS